MSVLDTAVARLADDGAPVWKPQRPHHEGCLLTWTSMDPESDGVWWPRTTDVATELRELLPTVETLTGLRTVEVALFPGDWRGDLPRRLRVGTQILRLYWMPRLPPKTVTLAMLDDPEQRIVRLLD